MKPNLIYLACMPILLGLYVAAPYAQTFTRIDTSIITRDGGYTQGSSWGDYDNDGDEDLFISIGSVTSGNHKNFFYRNDGGGNFSKVTTGDIVNDQGGACSTADYANDGDLDLLVTNGFFEAPFENYLYSNDGNNNHWINIKCTGKVCNRTASGKFCGDEKDDSYAVTARNEEHLVFEPA